MNKILVLLVRLLAEIVPLFSVSNVRSYLISLALVKFMTNGLKKLVLRVKMSNGLLQIRRNVQAVIRQLKRIRAAII